MCARSDEEGRGMQAPRAVGGGAQQRSSLPGGCQYATYLADIGVEGRNAPPKRSLNCARDLRVGRVEHCACGGHCHRKAQTQRQR